MALRTPHSCQGLLSARARSWHWSLILPQHCPKALYASWKQPYLVYVLMITPVPGARLLDKTWDSGGARFLLPVLRTGSDLLLPEMEKECF